ncbi:MAG: tail fiber domain-containing protein [Thermomicrobiales bacterium]
MDGSRFDRWTRRRFGRLAGGAAAALFGSATADAKKKRRRKKRCKKLGDTCTPGGKRRCCGNLRCDKTLVGNPSVLCCKGEGESCGGHIDCCDDLGCPAQTCVPVSSDRALKTNFASVDPADMLQRVRDLPITAWNYTSDDSSIRHIGPMAQDFAAAFGVGADDRHIHPIDGQGVALAAIQGLAREVVALRAENASLTARVGALEHHAGQRSPTRRGREIA